MLAFLISKVFINFVYFIKVIIQHLVNCFQNDKKALVYGLEELESKIIIIMEELIKSLPK